MSNMNLIPQTPKKFDGFPRNISDHGTRGPRRANKGLSLHKRQANADKYVARAKFGAEDLKQGLDEYNQVDVDYVAETDVPIEPEHIPNPYDTSFEPELFADYLAGNLDIDTLVSFLRNKEIREGNPDATYESVEFRIYDTEAALFERADAALEDEAYAINDAVDNELDFGSTTVEDGAGRTRNRRVRRLGIKTLDQ